MDKFINNEQALSEAEDTRPLFEDTRRPENLRHGLRRAKKMRLKAHLWGLINDGRDEISRQGHYNWYWTKKFYTPERIAKLRRDVRQTFLVNEGKDYRGTHHCFYDKDDWYTENRRYRSNREKSRMVDEGRNFVFWGVDRILSGVDGAEDDGAEDDEPMYTPDFTDWTD